MDPTRTLIHAPQAPPRTPAGARRARIVASRGAPAEERVLGRYTLLERLGAGGFGEVFRARDELLQREVALKRVVLAPGDDDERAVREAYAAARLSHPAIVALYEACPADDAFYLISELVDGDTLAHLIRDDALGDEEILEIGVALADALAHAHARGVIHRDIKPQNVLVPHRVRDAAGAAKLTDFGGARLAGEDALTRTGDVLGTLAYMAPEQSEGRQAGAEADLYALALVVYEALSGVNPVRGPTPAATARRIGRRLAPLARARRDLPRALTGAIDAALAPHPRDRGELASLRAALAQPLAHAPERDSRRRPPSPSTPAAAVHALPEQPHETPVAAVAAPRTADALIDTAPAPAAAPARATLPRTVWIGCAVALAAWQAASGRAGVALLLLAAMAPLLALPRRCGPAWLLAPALGALGLAGAYPALAGQLRSWRARAALGALGYWWLLLAEPLLARRLWLGPAPQTPPRGVWEPALGPAAAHVVGPLLTLGTLLGALLWALAAAALPVLVRGRNAALDIVAATVWAALVVAAAPALDAGLRGAGAHPAPRGAVLGAVLAGALAVAARALRGPVRDHRA